MSWRARDSSLLLLFIGALSSVAFLTGGISATNSRYVRLMFWGIVSLIVGAIATAITFTSIITLSDDAIELSDALHKKRLLIGEILGRREIVRAGREGITSTWKLVPKDNKARTLTLSNSYVFDGRFYEWLSQIPVLDAEETI